jgi:hypothetical protein
VAFPRSSKPLGMLDSANIISLTSLGIFLVFPPLLLITNAFGWHSIGKWKMVLFIALVGWLVINISIHAGFAHLAHRVEQAKIENAPNIDQLMDELQSDGASKVFGLMFGWLYALIYAAPWYLASFAVVWLRRKTSAKHA